MPLIAAKCTSCGANIEVDESKDAGICTHCGTAFVTEKAINNYNTYNIQNTSHQTTQHIVKNIYGKEQNEAEDYIRNGDVFLSLGEYERAKEAYDNAVKANPADAKGWFGLAAVITKNFTSIVMDKTVIDYVNKAFAVATPECQQELFRIYEPYNEKLRIILRFGLINGMANRYKGNESHVTIPDLVTSIGNGAFSGCTNLRSLTIPNSITKIDSFAFDGCTNLEHVTIPDSVTKVNSCAFYGWTSNQTIFANKRRSYGWAIDWNCGSKAKIQYR